MAEPANASNPEILATIDVFGQVAIAFASLAGLFLCGYACFIWYSKNSTKGGQKSSYSVAWTFLAGVALLLAPALYPILMTTGLGDTWSSNGFAVHEVSGAALDSIERNGESPLLQFLPENTVKIVSAFIYLLGLFAYLKGIYLLRFIGIAGDSSAAQGSSMGGKAMAHILGGLFVMNINAAACMILGIFMTMSVCQ